MSLRKRKGKKKKSRSANKKRAKKYVSFDIDIELRKALQYHESGQLEKANRIYDKILKVNPNHPDSLHLKGFLAHQLGKNDTVIELISKAI